MIKTLEINEIYPKIFRINLPLPLDVTDVNIYLIAGEVPTLIDAGIKTPLFFEAIKALMKKAGVQQIARILLTHWHVDHSGNTALLAKEGAEIFTSAIDYEEWLAFSKQDSFDTMHEWMTEEWGVPKEKVLTMYDNHCQFQTLFSFPSQVSLIQPDDFVQAGDYRVQVISTPGHTRGHLSYWLEQEKLIFTGDILLPDQIAFPGAWLEGKTRVSGLPAYIRSLKKLESLNGQRYFPAHGAPENDPSARCRVVLDQIRNQIARHVPAEDVYTGASLLGNKKYSSGYLYYRLHHVFGCETVQKQLKNGFVF
ncbi:MAG: hypothetical protein APF81_20570 [Desulfosporosinus sp. BRH_c37]|nr:MAG: hypothetical protein APF81_20570 [Desulfosporosinus sp. BRH_c37]